MLLTYRTYSLLVVAFAACGCGNRGEVASSDDCVIDLVDVTTTSVDVDQSTGLTQLSYFKTLDDACKKLVQGDGYLFIELTASVPDQRQTVLSSIDFGNKRTVTFGSSSRGVVGYFYDIVDDRLSFLTETESQLTGGQWQPPWVEARAVRVLFTKTYNQQEKRPYAVRLFLKKSSSTP